MCATAFFHIVMVALARAVNLKICDVLKRERRDNLSAIHFQHLAKQNPFILSYSSLFVKSAAVICEVIDQLDRFDG